MGRPCRSIRVEPRRSDSSTFMPPESCQVLRLNGRADILSRMLRLTHWGRAVAVLLPATLVAHAPSAGAQGAAAPRGVPENAVTHVSDHTYAIIGFPNIGIVVGTRGALVLDTGLGTKMGAVVVREVEKISKGPLL